MLRFIANVCGIFCVLFAFKVAAGGVGLHIHRMEDVGWPPAEIAYLRLWDAGVRWSQIQPSREVFDWTKMDRRVGAARAHGAAILYTLGPTPNWAASKPDEPGSYGPGSASLPANMADWQSYAFAVARRYRGQIEAYEIWNEPNEAGFFSGDVSQMIVMTTYAAKAIRDGDPFAKIVCPAPVAKSGLKWLELFAKNGGLQSCDVVAFHFYVTPGPPEAMLSLVAQVQQIVSRYDPRILPLWNSEFGWYVVAGASKPMAAEGFKTRVDEHTVASYLVRANLLMMGRGVTRNYYYAWDNDEIGLATKAGIARPGAAALAVFAKWILDKDVHSCSATPAGTMHCQICGKAQTCETVAWSTVPRAVAWGSFAPNGTVDVIDLTTGVTAPRNTDSTGQLSLTPAPIAYKTP